jgi:hypothetical protein
VAPDWRLLVGRRTDGRPEAAAAAKETSVVERENALADREQTSLKESLRLSALKIEYEAKLKKLKELAI